jgi:RNA polymerase sigma-70 factor (ECF subfamily)
MRAVHSRWFAVLPKLVYGAVVIGAESDTTDTELLEAWRGGDQAAGSALLDRHFESVCRFFSNKIADDPEDLIQKTLLACVVASDSFDGRSSFRSFLFSIARNTLYAYFRGKRRASFDPLSSSVQAMGTSAGTLLARAEDEELLHAGLRRLPLEQQTLLELAYWEELKGPELADVLGVSAGAVRVRLTRARAALREEIGNTAPSKALAKSALERLGSDLLSDE